MSRLLYEKSVSYQGHLIVPFIWGTADSAPIYSYRLLSELAHKGQLHKTENPAGIYSSSLATIIEIAREHLDFYSDVANPLDFFKNRYTYRNELIIVYQIAGKYFYDHYKPESLNNVAAPTIFKSERECIAWIKQGIDRAVGEREGERGSRGHGE